MKNDLTLVKVFKDEIIEEIQKSPKTSWGKNELMAFLKEQYTDFLERSVE